MSEKVTPLFSDPPAMRPPAQIEAEQQVLGAVFMAPKTFERLAAIIEADHFFDPVHAVIWRAMAKRVAAGDEPGALQINADLGPELRDKFDGGPPAYFAGLIARCISPRTAPQYARMVRDAWIRREAIQVAQAITQSANAPPSPDRPAELIVSEGVGSLLRLGETVQSESDGATLGAAVSAAFGRAEAAHRGDQSEGRLDTGIGTFDRFWGGLWPGQLYYLMARSRTGKSSAMAQIARNVAGKLASGEHVHILSLEMTEEDYGVVNLAQVTSWTSDQIRSGEIGTSEDWLELDRARASLAALPIHIDAPGRLTLAQLHTRARVIAQKHKSRLLMIDHQRLIRKDSEHRGMGLPEWIPFLSYEIKSLAKSLGIPIISLQQVTKSGSRDGQRPVLDDLPYDGGEAADGVYALHRPELYLSDEPAPDDDFKGSAEKRARALDDFYQRRQAARGLAEFGALKRRFGSTGWTTMRFVGERMSFVDNTGAAEDPPPLERAPGLWD